MHGEMIEARCDRAGRRALHVDRAAAVERVAVRVLRDLARKRRMRPGRLVARRDDVGVAREDEMRRAGADAGVEVLTGAVPGSVKVTRWTSKPAAFNAPSMTPERAVVRRRHRRTAQQRAGKRDGIGGWTCSWLPL